MKVINIKIKYSKKHILKFEMLFLILKDRLNKVSFSYNQFWSLELYIADDCLYTSNGKKS